MKKQIVSQNGQLGRVARACTRSTQSSGFFTFPVHPHLEAFEQPAVLAPVALLA